MADGRGKYEVAKNNDNSSNDGESGGFLSFIYDSSTGRILGRTCDSWAKILIFYLIYYACLAGFFIGMMSVFLYGVILSEKPLRTGEHSLLTLKPGLAFRPQPDSSKTLIKFEVNDKASYQKYLDDLLQLYQLYNKSITIGKGRTNCGPNDKKVKSTDLCELNWAANLNNCLPQDDFGYAIGQPCVIIKMNKIFGWLPNPSNNSQYAPHTYVTCEGENRADDATIGNIEVKPSARDFHNNSKVDGSRPSMETSGYFHNAYFPYVKQLDYQRPLVAVRFNNILKNTLVMVRCQLYNDQHFSYEYKTKRPDGAVRFEIFVKA